MSRTQAEIDKDRSTMAQAIVDGQRLKSLNDAKRFAKGWIETAAQHASNEAYYHDERDALLRLIIEVRSFLSELNVGATGHDGLLARVDERVRDAGLLLEPSEGRREFRNSPSSL
jgi:hypothetical protein